MILQRLYELAVRERMLDDPAFEELPVKFAIQIGSDGKYLGMIELIGDSPPTAAGKAPAKSRQAAAGPNGTRLAECGGLCPVLR